jgi:hypothetical protein
VARRRDVNREALSEADLVALRKRLAAMTLHELEIQYQASHNACRYAGVRVPAPIAMQELVQVWRQLRRVFSKQGRGAW